MGVTSRISVTLNPAVWSARSALSRPAPGPFTKTATERIPCSCARRAASSAASCAAKGVDLREPLKPRAPADDQATALPLMSVIVTTVLLNVDWMWAMPAATFLRTFFFCLTLLVAVLALAMLVSSLLDYGLGAAAAGRRCSMPLRGPLRVRELVCVRCPLTGRPRR